MPIPNFDYNFVLPPHLGNPTSGSDLSPYRSSTLEFCKHFSTSQERITILKQYLNFRQKLTDHGIIHGFQWLDGSFLENIEVRESRPPNDLDLVTFYGGLTPEQQQQVMESFPDFADPILSKKNYMLDHYAVDYMFHPEVTVEQTRYWLQLFSHNRIGVWKGMLRLPLNTQEDDDQALEYLNSL
jgi:hypothetical protein